MKTTLQPFVPETYVANTLVSEAVQLLSRLISIPSFSGNEDLTAEVLFRFFERKNIPVSRAGNNIWVTNKYFKEGLPVVLLNSHHDTVKPNAGYTRNPFEPTIEEDKLFGLGSNDAGGCLVSLAAVFLHFYAQEDLKYNIVFVASAEEENSGPNGIEMVLPLLPPIDFAIVGEPTKMQMAIAEKGLLVLDCVSKGRSGHAARNEGINAIYQALHDIEWFRTYRFPKVSGTLGVVKMSVTMIDAGTQHNVVPDTCRFTVDVRTTDVYPNQVVLDEIRQHVKCSVTPRSTRLNSSFMPTDHVLLEKAAQLGFRFFGSLTTSDQALMPFPSVKLGPGDSARSHTADEYILIPEIYQSIQCYIQLLQQVIV